MTERTVGLLVPRQKSVVKPQIETVTYPGLIIDSLERLKLNGFSEARLRNIVTIDNDPVYAEVHNLDNEDALAGFLLLSYLSNDRGLTVVHSHPITPGGGSDTITSIYHTLRSPVSPAAQCKKIYLGSPPHIIIQY